MRASMLPLAIVLISLPVKAEWTPPDKTEIALHTAALGMAALDVGLSMRAQSVRPGFIELNPLLPERPSTQAWLTASATEALLSTALWLALPDWRWRLMLDAPLAAGHALGAITGAQVLLSTRW